MKKNNILGGFLIFLTMDYVPHSHLGEKGMKMRSVEDFFPTLVQQMAIVVCLQSCLKLLICNEYLLLIWFDINCPDYCILLKNDPQFRAHMTRPSQGFYNPE